MEVELSQVLLLVSFHKHDLREDARVFSCGDTVCSVICTATLPSARGNGAVCILLMTPLSARALQANDTSKCQRSGVPQIVLLHEDNCTSFVVTSAILSNFCA